MWSSVVLVVLCLYFSTLGVHSACPAVVLYGDKECESRVRMDLRDSERVLADNWAHEDLDWDTSVDVTPISARCSTTFFMCVDSPTVFTNAINVSGVDTISINVTLDVFFGNPAIEVCIKYSNQPLDGERRLGNDCSEFSHATPKTVSVPNGKNLVYLVLRAPSSNPAFCMTLQRVTVKYEVCPCKVQNFVNYPEVAMGSGLFRAQCVNQAHAITDLQFSMSTCMDEAVGGAKCACDPGHEGSNNGQLCTRSYSASISIEVPRDIQFSSQKNVDISKEREKAIMDEIKFEEAHAAKGDYQDTSKKPNSKKKNKRKQRQK